MLHAHAPLHLTGSQISIYRKSALSNARTPLLSSLTNSGCGCRFYPSAINVGCLHQCSTCHQVSLANSDPLREDARLADNVTTPVEATFAALRAGYLEPTETTTVEATQNISDNQHNQYTST